MRVHFITKKNRGKLVISANKIKRGKKITVSRGKYATSDVDEIMLLLSSPFATTNVELAPGQDIEAINRFLLGIDSDDYLSRSTMTHELMEQIDLKDFEAWDKLARLAGLATRSPFVGIIKAQLAGREITTEMHSVIEKHRIKDQDEEEKTRDEQDVKTEAFEEPEQPAQKVSIKKKRGRPSKKSQQEAVATE